MRLNYDDDDSGSIYSTESDDYIENELGITIGSIFDDFSLLARQPEFRLWISVINLAIMDAASITTRLKKRKEKACIYITQNQRSALNYLSSRGFERTCLALQIDPDEIKEALKKRFDWARILYQHGGYGMFYIRREK